MSTHEPAASATSASRPARLGATALVLALLAAAMWFAWLGWDHEYYKVDGVWQGPYRSWQVLGCGASVAVAAVLAQLWVRGRTAIFVLSAAADLGFAVPWGRDAGSTDETGLWGVGLILLVVGAGAGLTVLLSACEMLARLLGSWRRSRRGPRGADS